MILDKTIFNNHSIAINKKTKKMNLDPTDISIIIGIIGLTSTVIPLYQYIGIKRQDQKLKDFENYHRLIKELVQPEKTTTGESEIYADRQAAIIFELRYFKRHYEFSHRTLNRLKTTWTNNNNNNNNNNKNINYKTVLDEIDFTLVYLETKQRRWHYKIYKFCSTHL